MITIGEWLENAHSKLAAAPDFDDDRPLTLKYLVEARLKLTRPLLGELAISSAERQRLDEDVSLLCDGVPLPYVMGEWSFYGLDFHITPAVLIPRPETELLVEEALHWLGGQKWLTRPNIYDIGTGSGVIAISIAKNQMPCSVTASDISPEALEVCKTNILKHGLTQTVKAVCTDGIPDDASGIDLLCANLPYIPSSTVDTLKVTRFEPRLALDGGDDGMGIIEKVLKKSAPVMNPHSLMLFEIEERQYTPAIVLAQKYFPHSTMNVLKDLGGKDRLLRIENT